MTERLPLDEERKAIAELVRGAVHAAVARHQAEIEQRVRDRGTGLSGSREVGFTRRNGARDALRELLFIVDRTAREAQPWDGRTIEREKNWSVLVQDGVGHWYVIPAYQRDQWAAFVGTLSNGDASGEYIDLPRWAAPMVGDPSTVEFQIMRWSR